MITKTQDNILLKMSQGWALTHVPGGCISSNTSGSCTELRKGHDFIRVRQDTFEALSNNRLVCRNGVYTYKLTERGQQIVAVMVTGSNIVAGLITGSKMGSHRELGNEEGI